MLRRFVLDPAFLITIMVMGGIWYLNEHEAEPRDCVNVAEWPHKHIFRDRKTNEPCNPR